LNLQDLHEETDSADQGHRPIKVGFLFNHDHLHQILHSAPILAALAEENPELELHAFVTGEDKAAFLRRILQDTAALRRTAFHTLEPPVIAKGVDWLLGGAAPMARIGTLFRYRKDLSAVDTLVVPETTSTLLKTRFGCHRIKLIYTQHGAGDRAVGFEPVLKEFDYVLLPGEKIKNRMLKQELIADGGYSVVGYPKFDFIAGSPHKRPFDNHKPTVLYNPHFHPGLSSWFDDGIAVLDFFRRQSEFNLIFAPHVLLFARRLHVAIDKAKFRWRKSVPDRFRDCSNILVDTGSPASVDMTYTRAADIYLGDASSQVYEFIHQPKPCIFLNSRQIDWHSDRNYTHWHLGRVIGHVDELEGALSPLSWHDELYAKHQADALTSTFGAPLTGGAKRAASAINRFVLSEPRRRAAVTEEVSA
jgi:hypothetical protein